MLFASCRQPGLLEQTGVVDLGTIAMADTAAAVDMISLLDCDPVPLLVSPSLGDVELEEASNLLAAAILYLALAVPNTICMVAEGNFNDKTAHGEPSRAPAQLNHLLLKPLQLLTKEQDAPASPL